MLHELSSVGEWIEDCYRNVSRLVDAFQQFALMEPIGGVGVLRARSGDIVVAPALLFGDVAFHPIMDKHGRLAEGFFEFGLEQLQNLKRAGPYNHLRSDDV